MAGATSTSEMIFMLTTIAGAGGLFVGWGIAWGTTRKTVTTLVSEVRIVKESIEKHHADRRIHVDPERDGQILEGLRDLIDENFAEIKATLKQVNTRCEARGMDCTKHFTGLEKKLAAYTGKSNGEEK
jgi:hypothetical protein